MVSASDWQSSSPATRICFTVDCSRLSVSGEDRSPPPVLGETFSPLGLHTLRSGDATATANAGVNDSLFKRHGRWQSDKAKDGFVKDNSCYCS